jgi:hypothetical protein
MKKGISFLEARAEQKVIKPEVGAPAIGHRLPDRRDWSEVEIPDDASPIARLTYLPGLVGDGVEWMVRGAHRPVRMMSLASSLVVVATVGGRFVVGPSGNATHLYICILLPGWGKERPLKAGKEWLGSVADGALLGPEEFASSPGFLKFLSRHPCCALFADEIGDEFRTLHAQKNNGFVEKVFGTLKKCYNGFETIRTAEKVGEQSITIVWPAPSLCGAATAQSVFGSFTENDLSGGFANRLLTPPSELVRKPALRTPPPEAMEPPEALIKALLALPNNRVGILDRTFDDKPAGTVKPEGRHFLEWGVGAEEAFQEFSVRTDAIEEEADQKRYWLSMRCQEHVLRLATVVAYGCNRVTVDLPDIEWAIGFAEASLDCALGGVEKYMVQYFEFPKFCDEVLAKIKAEGGWMSELALIRFCRKFSKYGVEGDRVLEQLKRECRIVSVFGGGSRGPRVSGYRLVPEEEVNL